MVKCVWLNASWVFSQSKNISLNAIWICSAQKPLICHKIRLISKKKCLIKLRESKYVWLNGRMIWDSRKMTYTQSNCNLNSWNKKLYQLCPFVSHYQLFIVCMNENTTIEWTVGVFLYSSISTVIKIKAIIQTCVILQN